MTTHPSARAAQPGAKSATTLERIARHLFRLAFRGWRDGCVVLRCADGQTIELGSLAAEHHHEVRVLDDRLFARVLVRGEMGVGESFVAGEWETADLVGLIRLLLRNSDAVALETPITRLARLPDLLRHRFVRANDRRGSQRNIGDHYDLGNDFYRVFLDPSMSYSCALFDNDSSDLEAAQRAKLDRLCDMLELGSGDHLLDIGAGWGAMCMHAATTRGCQVTGITISRAQLDLATERVRAAGLQDRVTIRLCDYRDIEGTFDKIVSIEMIEAVGFEYLDTWFAKCGELLAPGGRLAVQTITIPDERFEAYRRGIDWMQTYVFPGSLLPSRGTLSRTAKRTGLAIIQDHEIGPHYARTLNLWRRRLRTSPGGLTRLDLTEQFLRTWNLYLAFSEASFAEGTLGDAQLLFERAG